jgi:CysZ protein
MSSQGPRFAVRPFVCGSRHYIRGRQSFEDHVMLAAAGQAFQELFTPPFRSVLWKCVGFTIGLLALLVIAIEWTFSHFVQWPGWIETTIEWLGGFALVAGSIFLIPPVTSLIAGLYLDDIAAEVERTDYPSDPPGRALETFPAILLALKFFFVVLAVNILALFLLLIPGINLIAFYLGNGYLLGREYFELAAMRHLPVEEVKRLRKANVGYVSLCGLVIAGVASVPILNLITPLFATAFMVRIYKQLAARAGLRLARRGV